MREIKFNAVDEATCDYVRFDDFVSELEKEYDDTHNELLAKFLNDYYGYKLLLYTGLKDRNGAEIYDGDVVRWGMNGIELSGVRYAVVNMFPSLKFDLLFYEDEKSGIRNPPLIPFSFEFPNFIHKDTDNYLEVVGNIYENKEFLN